MPKKRRWWRAVLGVSVALILGLGVAGYRMAPGWAKSYIEERYPGVAIGSVEIHWLRQGVTLHDVQVDRGNLKASLPLVHGDRAKNVQVVGGTVTLTVEEEGGAEKAASSDSGVNLTAEDLEVTVRYKGATAELKRTKVNKEEVCFEEGTVTHPKLKAALLGGCAKRDKSLVKIGQVEVPVTLPVSLPRIEPEQTVTVHALVVEPKEKRIRFDRVLVSSWAAIQGGKVELAGDKVFFESPLIEVEHAWLAPHPVNFEKVAVTAPLGVLKGEKGLIEVHLGNATVLVDPTDKAIGGSEPCGDWFDAMPRPLPDAMKGMAGHYQGELTVELRVKPEPKVSIKTTCKFDCKAEPIASIRGKPKFRYWVYDASNKLVEREAGPTIEGWTFLSNLPPGIPRSFVLMEDPDFPAHKGVLPQALENSLKINLEKGEFAKGGSTITMQLAKNLWLRRTKSVTRKAEEALLTYALESCFSKEQILELYLNVIEFGPNLYGLGPAAKHYFKKDPAHLSPEEAFYLASILPAPRKALPPQSGGLARAKRIMKALAHSGFISEYLIEDDASAPASTSGWEVND